MKMHIAFTSICFIAKRRLTTSTSSFCTATCNADLLKNEHKFH